MLDHNKQMQEFLRDNGIQGVIAKRIDNGSMRGCWRLSGKNGSKSPNILDRYQKWTPEITDKLHRLGFHDFDGQALSQYSGNGGLFCIFAREPIDYKHNKIKSALDKLEV